MTLFLASVRDAAEAETALSHGADIIDAKDPSRGALGAVDPAELVRIVAAVGGRRPVSAVLGDLPMQPASLAAAVLALREIELTYIKVGLFPSSDMAGCIAALGAQDTGAGLIGVMFADLDHDPTLLDAMAAAGFVGVMIDTAGKSRGRLLEHMELASLRTFVGCARALGLKVGLAGSLELPDIPRLLPIGPDYLGFRRVLCGSGGRSGGVEVERVRAVRDLIPVENGHDRGLPSARNHEQCLADGYFAPHREPRIPDRIFVRDFVLPMRVGVYDHEHERAQRVRFNVEVDITPTTRPPHDMRDVVSYDVITDGISLIAAREHVALVETLAEKVAALALSMPRAVRVRVAVEKLDLHSGTVGVEITRDRPTEAGHNAGRLGHGDDN